MKLLNNTYRKVGGITLVLATMFFSCSKELNMELPQMEPKIVVHGFLNPENPIQVYLHQSDPDFSDSLDFKPIEGAEVDVFEDGQYLCRLHDMDSTYLGVGEVYRASGIHPRVGSSYRIKVKAAGLEEVEATTAIPEKRKLRAVDFLEGTRMLYDQPAPVINCRLTLKVDRDQERYYAFQFNKGYHQVGPVNRYGYLIEYPHFFSDSRVVDNTYTFLVARGSRDDPTDTLDAVSELYSITRDYYLYHESIFEYMDKDDHLPFLEDVSLPITEPQQVYSNIEGGLGLFTGVNVSRDSVRIVVFE